MEVISKQNKKYPEQLLKIQDPPKKIYIEGNSTLLSQNSIAIVGSRDATEYGKKYASIFSKKIAQKGVAIVSGMAEGIDTIAHLYSMKEKGKTIAVLGSGLNQIAEEKKALYQQILDNGGCVVSEYEPEVQACSANYPRRNRIISGLSMGVLIVEAAYRSGTTITAKHAIKQGKEIFCIPNQLGVTNGYSSNLLIKNGANLVTCPEDILSYYISEEKPEYQGNESKIPLPYQEIYKFIKIEPRSVNELAKISGKTVVELEEALCVLELEGVIKHIAGNQYCKL